jgi:RNA polymerase sigma-70 factor, ECF subfamily
VYRGAPPRRPQWSFPAAPLLLVALKLGRVLVVTDRGANVEQFVQLFAKCQMGLQAYIWTLVANRADADDLMQETSVALWRKWSEYDPQRDFFRWACGIAFIEVLRYRRRTASERLWFSEELMETLAVEFLSDSAVYEQRTVALQGCLEKLPARDRKIIEARYRNGATIQAVAEELRRPVSTLYKMVARIRDRLHMCIEGTIARESHP